MKLNEAERDRLEVEFVDRFGLAGLMDALSTICFDKAEHVKANWGPPINNGQIPKIWNELSDVFGRAESVIRQRSNYVQGR